MIEKQVDKWINNLRDHAALFITNNVKRKSHYANIELSSYPNRLIIIIKFFFLWLYRIYSELKVAC